MAATTFTVDKLGALMLEQFDQIMSSIADLRIELKGDIQRLDFRMNRLEKRMDGVEDKVEQLRRAFVEDGSIYTSMLFDHKDRIKRLEKWRVTQTAI